MDIHAFRAKQLRDYYDKGKEVIRDEDLVLNIFTQKSDGNSLKREEIISEIEKKFSLDREAASVVVADGIKILSESKKIFSPQYGYWKLS